METAILQIRDVPASVVETLRARAERQDMSLSAYIRRLLADEVEHPPMEEVLAQIATDEPVEVSNEEILAAIHEGRR